MSYATEDQIDAEQREFGRAQMGAEYAPSTPLAEVLEAAVRALLLFHMADDKLLEQGRIAWLLQDAERVAELDVREPLAFLRRMWSAGDAREMLERYKNKDFANMLRGIELVVRTRAAKGPR